MLDNINDALSGVPYFRRTQAREATETERDADNSWFLKVVPWIGRVSSPWSDLQAQIGRWPAV
ncbi:hypothetical protein OKW38_001557 [Paraburkholderia sp. MM5496-R1]